MVTLNQIASEMKLSRTTVSYALGEQWRRVGLSPVTRGLIMAKAQQLGYRRSPIATSLKTQVTKTIGVVVPNINGDAYEHMLHGIEEAVGSDYTLLLGVSDYDKDKERKVLQSFYDRLVDGLIIVHSGYLANVDWVKKLIEFEIAVVQADRAAPGLKTDFVEADNEAIGAMLTEHFVKSGYQQIFFVRAPNINTSTIARAEGYRKAMRRHGLKPRLIPEQPLNLGQNRATFGYEKASKLIRETHGRRCILTHELGVGFGVLRACRELGVEAEVVVGSVTNASDNPIYEFLPRQLTRVAWSVRDMGFHAGELLRQRLQQPPGKRSVPKTVRIPGRIISR